MKILCIGYRDWAKKIYKSIKLNKKIKIYYHFKKSGIYKKVKNISPNIILFYGWSWRINKSLFSKYNCFMLHPSMLPKYRGGSPIQNQIIRNEKNSAVTIFKINQIIDGGDIYYQKKISLNGSLKEIFKKIIKYGVEGTNKIVHSKKIKVRKQNHKLATYFKRRNPKQSEITLKEIKNKPSYYIINKIRMLEDPYPNAFIKLKDKKLIIKNFIIK